MTTTYSPLQFAVEVRKTNTGTIKGTSGDIIKAGTLLVFDPSDSKWKVWNNEDIGKFGFSMADLTIPAANEVANENIITEGLVRDSLITLPDGVTLATIPNEKQVIEPIQYQVEDLAAGADISTKAFYMPLKATTIEGLGILTQGTPAGIDDSNTAVITIKNGSDTVVEKTYNTATQPPTSDYETLGTLTNSDMTDSEFLTIAVTQGTTANLPAFMIVGTAIRSTEHNTNLYYTLLEQGLIADTFLENCY